MRHRGRWLASFRAARTALRIGAGSFAICLVLATAARAGDVDIRGEALKGFGRIELKFDRTTKITVRASAGVLVIGFATPSRIRAERLTGELAGYVSVVRRDPDDTGLRLALTAPVRTNVLEAGERVFVDLLPVNWSGLSPGLPPEVVAALAERARVAEEKVRETALRPPSRKAVQVRLAQISTLTRFVFEPPPGVAFRFRQVGSAIEGEFDGPLTVDLAGSRPKGARGLSDFKTTEGERSLAIRIVPSEGYDATGFVEADTLVIDLAKPSRAPPDPGPAPAPPTPAPEPPVKTAPAEPIDPAPKNLATPETTRPAPEPVRIPDPEPPPIEMPRGSPRSPVSVRASFQGGEDGAGSIQFPFVVPTPAAAFVRGDRVTVVFDTADTIDPASLEEAVKRIGRLESIQQDAGVAIISMRRDGEKSLRLVAESGGWRLAVGDTRGVPPDEAPISQTKDESGQPQVLATFPSAAAVHWLEDAGSGPIAVVTASGRPRALLATRRFVEFTLASTLQGLVVEPRAEDIQVSLGRGGAIVSRRSGLSLSSPAAPGEPRKAGVLVANRDTWQDDTPGTEMSRYHELSSAASSAPRSGRAEARFRLARFLVANGMSFEAGSVLALARSEDSVFARRREPLILAAIAAVRSRRPKEARALLAAEVLADDPEAVLWRAAADALTGQWSKAVAGFRTASSILDRYPEDLAGELGIHALRAALAIDDLAAADVALAVLDRLSLGAVPRDLHDLARARLDEASGRTEAAATAYERLAAEGSRPVEAEAILRSITLAARTAKMKPELAIAKLETLVVAWRGGEVELGSLVELARLYAAAGRWRDMFLTARRADTYFPLEEATRQLHDDTTRRFEALILEQEGAKLPAIDVLSLYYDFKDLAPIGRRGDEIVRRLADRLVEIDLLDQAAELLQYQVDKRLTGTARAAVATRLAAIRLIANKPREALAALETTRLAEMPASLRRFRLLIEAQTQAELGRIDLGLEIASGEEGEDFARLRAGMLFGASRWREAGEAYERLVGLAWQRDGTLSDAERQDVIRAAIADVLADEGIAVGRLRIKFGAKMADSPDAKSFDGVVRPGSLRTPEFRSVLRDVGKAPSLRRLLADWSAVPLDIEAGRDGRPPPARQG